MIYRGLRRDGRAVVTVDGKPLPLRLDLFNHSPDGFEWGYSGSGPAQLALAILAYHLKTPRKKLGPFETTDAIRLHQQFKRRVVARLDRDKPWALTSEEIGAVLLELDRQ